ncbi:hypothetical protein ACQCSX_04305 [Pseudarthrobacter sp. P1]|uniref:hypothetical protein n=1 Tax=Pseudarthrobacter sp. P1 TaxID=3418418 RepID=UPI003CF1E032
MSALDQIRARALDCRTYNFGMRAADKLAHDDAFRLLAAVDAVTALHQPFDAVMYTGRHQRMVQVCTGCGTDDGNWNRYPCPTITAITTALEGTK